MTTATAPDRRIEAPRARAQRLVAEQARDHEANRLARERFLGRRLFGGLRGETP